MQRGIALALGIGILALVGCSKSDSGSGRSYSFTASASSALGLKVREAQQKLASLEPWLLTLNPKFTEPFETRTGPTLCSSVVCFTPTALTGVYYGTGLLIQSNGNGMVGYFGQTEWSSITSASPTYSFNVSTPITNAGNFFCCTGTGDLSSSNTYISDTIYLFGYLDATFTVSGVTSNTNMNRSFTVRFIFADGAYTGALRGDVLLKDPSGGGTFYWIDTASSAGGDVGNGTLTSTRPTTPVKMNTSVVNWTNPFGSSKGNQNIPVIYAGVIPQSGSGVMQTSEAVLSATGKTYTYNFDATNFVMFPQLLTADINTLSTYTQLLTYIHLGGLPHSAQSMGVGNPASTQLVITP